MPRLFYDMGLVSVAEQTGLSLSLSEAPKSSEYDQEILQSQTADPWHREEEPHNNHETPGRQTMQSNQLSLPHQDDRKTRRDIN